MSPNPSTYKARETYYDIHAERIESSQKKFPLFALRNMGWKNSFNLPKYEKKLLHMSTLKHRRKVAMAKLIFKLITCKIGAPHLINQIRFNENYRSTIVNI